MKDREKELITELEVVRDLCDDKKMQTLIDAFIDYHEWNEEMGFKPGAQDAED